MNATAARPANRDQELIGSLIGVIDGVLDPLVPRDGAVALVDFPHAPNVGDSLIWLGTLAWLRASGRGAPRVACSEFTYDPRTLARRIGSGTILLSGGGNFGDLYENHQRLRERVIADFPDHRIVQLPQTLHFHATENLERARSVLNRHAKLTLLVRDHRSLAIAGEEFHAPAILCPDMSLCLGALPRRVPATRPIVWLSRRDKEAMAEAPIRAPVDVRPVDWLSDDPRTVIRFNRSLSRGLRHRPELRPWLAPWITPTFDTIARMRLERGARILGAGERVVTNRLHGHILSLLLGIPHYVVDNSYGKVRNFHEAWTRESKLTRFCETQAEALRLAVAEAGVAATR
ncbi:MAG: polysaccharide pyruvyl transferase family protein [Candidatus Eisenbacteria bacterium]